MISVFGRPFVKRFDCPMLSDCCLSVCLSVCSVLSVTLVYCGQTVGWIKMKLGMEVGLGSLRQHCVRWGLSFPQKGQAQISGPRLLWPNGWMDQDATWYRARPRPRRHCVRWGPSSPKGHSPSSPQFSAHVCCGQMAGWIKMSLSTDVCLGPDHTTLC